MTTSRTGTTSHKKWRTHIITRDHNTGITHCPICGTQLNYTTPKQPNSAEADHIIPYSHGGQNTPENGRTICRTCNQKRGNKPTKTTTTQPATTTTTIPW
ncbi:HNH endonuclease [Actinobaculum sp. 352]|uniref:HNH endonuclease n=1 Tax=Actinobaculum sp. 352 TaxID=2490946 RepID=UPI000F7D9FE7|nr:HNH endonuclease [Actinobaculum sp. 352]RTE49627.1 HNH endonuclease [Actinobaculum sp. 352]